MTKKNYDLDRENYKQREKECLVIDKIHKILMTTSLYNLKMENLKLVL